jgi:hypothetical protein
MLIFALVISKLEYASIAWNSVTINDFNKLERIQEKSAALCHNRFFQRVEYHYDNIWKNIKVADTACQALSLWYLVFNKCF